MIEGLRVFPAYQDARRRKAVVSDCVTCKREQTMTTRQAIGCGYEPALADAQAWAMYLSNCYWDGNRPTQTEADGLNRLTINLKMGTNTVTTSDLTLSGFRMAVA